MSGTAIDKRALLVELLQTRNGTMLRGGGAASGADTAPAVIAPVEIAGRGPAQRARDVDAADAIAVVGVACRFPGARGRAAFWRLLRDGRDAVTRVPEGRWAAWQGGGDPDLARRGWAGLLDGVDEFEAEMFKLTPAEAELLDPQQRLFLQAAWHALEDAGCGEQRLAGARCGVFVAAGAGDYGRLLQAAGLDVEAQAFTGLSPSVLAGRIAYLLDLRGPCMTVDTACSSSLVALTLAWQSVRRGEAELALAGGVFTMTTPEMALRAHAAGMLSPSGRCRAFDAAADGIVLGEGAGAVVLKPLARALADRDHVYGVIRGAGINQDGRTNGITAPSARAQRELERMVYAQAGIDPRDISYVEAHGTGTALGDPIEVKALREVFGASDGARPWCALGSVKTNIGHTTMAAGIASFIKVLLALDHEQLPPSLHYERPNPRLELAGSPFLVNAHATPWPRAEDRPRLAAVSAFGFSGTNCHVVVSDGPRPPRAERDRAYHLAVVSARTEDALGQRCRDLAAHLAEAERPLELRDLAFSLLVGRTHLEVRAAFVVASTDELAARLDHPFDRPFDRPRAAAAAAASDAAARRWLAEGAPDPVDPAQARAWLEQLGELYMAGGDHDLDWGKLYETGGAQRVPLPEYPFARDRYWVTPPADDHRETVRLRGDEPFLGDHRIAGRPTLPAAALLELARAAGARALGARVSAVREVVLEAPFTIDEPGRELHEVQVQCRRGARRFEIASAAGRHASGTLSLDPVAEPAPFDRAAVERRCAEVLPPERLYDHFRAHGLDHGPRMRGIAAVRRGQGEALLAIAAPPAVAAGDRDALDAARLDEVLLDAVLQGVAALLLHVERDTTAYLPFAIGALELHGPLADARWVHVRQVAPAGGASYCFELTVAADDGRVLACVREFGLRSAAPGRRADEVLYGVPRWTEAPLDGSGGRIAGPVLAFVAPGPLEDQLRTAAGAARVVSVRRGDRFARIDADHYAIRPEVEDDHAALLAEIGALPSAVVHLWCLGPDPDGDPLLAVRSLFHAARAWLVTASEAALRVVFAYGGSTTPAACAAVGAFARSVRREAPRIEIATVALDDRWDDPRAAAEAVIRELGASGPQVPEIRYRGGVRERLGLAELPRPAGARPPVRDGGVYLITGGHGALGRILARDLAERWRARVVVLGRRAAEATAHADYLRCDVTQRSAVDAAIAEILDRHGALHGVFHAAGVLDDGLLVTRSWAGVERVIAPKWRGAIALDEATRDMELDLFVVFSSIAGVFGNAGQAGYAFANRLVSELAEAREAQRARGARRGQTVAVEWPLWRAGGMAMPIEDQDEMRRRTGLGALDERDALDALWRSLALGAPRVTILAGDGARIRATLLQDDAPLARPRAPVTATAPAAADPALVARVQAYLTRVVADRTKHPVHRLRAGEPLESYGIDSVTIVGITRRLEQDFGELSRTLLFEHRTVSALADYFVHHHRGALDRVLGGAAPEQAAPGGPPGPSPRGGAAEVRPADAEADAAIAIIGMHGRYPQAPSLEALWRNLCEGRDAIVEIPVARWDARRYDPAGRGPSAWGTSYGRWGGFLDEVDRFDAELFKVSPREASLMDPQERLFLESAWRTLEDAACSAASLRGARVGVFAGVMYGEYQLVADPEQGAPAVVSSYASIANRVSYFFDFRGPSLAVDTMCSSSLTALHLACASLRRRECDLALVGGVNLSLHPRKYQFLSQHRFLSSDGRCRSFGLGGDGYVPGEGVGTLLLRRLPEAIHAGDRIAAVIRGTSVNHGGHTNGYSVPDPRAQGEVIAEAWAQAGAPTDTIGYLEAHGTGTALGDPIELSALNAAFGERPPRSCALGSLKSNVGHLEAAAGVAAIHKVVLQLRHRALVPSLHAEQLNPQVPFAGSPFAVQRRLEPWPALTGPDDRPLPRRAGVSSFGAGGANAHVVLEEAPPPIARSPRAASPQLIVVSARSRDRLLACAQDLIEVLAARDPAAPIAVEDVAFTLQVGRAAMEHRLAFVARGLDEVVAGLRAFAGGTGAERDGVVQGNLLEGDSTPEPARRAQVAEALAAGDLVALARHWVMGAEIDWLRLHAGSRPRRIALPGYAMARTRCWFDRLIPARPDAAAPAAPASLPATRTAGKVRLSPVRPEPEAVDASRIPVAEAAPRAALEDRAVVAEATVAPVASAAPAARRAPDRAGLQREVAEIVGRVLFAEAGTLDLARPLVDLGFDSVLGVELVNELNARWGLGMKVAQLYGAVTIRDLAELVASWIARAPEPAAEPRPEPEPEPEPSAPTVATAASLHSAPSDGIAVVGMSCRFAGAADWRALWANLRDGIDSITEVPPERWSVAEHFDASGSAGDRSYSKWGGFLEGVDEFDAAFFQIAPAEAELMDPQQRLFLQEAWRAFEDAGYAPPALDRVRCGVFVGVMQNEYAQRCREHGRDRHPALAMLGNSISILPSRIAYYLNLRGPTLAVDTACSSSAVAVHLACQSLSRGETDVMLAGGVSLYLGPEAYVMMSQAGMLSPRGRCHTFDDRADGFVPGEGVAAVVLKRVADAVRDGDHIYGIIRASGINQDGRSNGITAPNLEAQRDLVIEVLRTSGVDPATIGYVEAHGTGTRLGDPVEIEALTTAFRQVTDARLRCAIGSIKTNLGHTSAAAGLAGLIKLLTCLRADTIAPSLHFTRANDHIDFATGPFFVARERLPWPREAGAPRRAALSSFGYSGTNCHVLVEDAPPRAPAGARPHHHHHHHHHLIALSAPTAERLAEMAERLARWAAEEGDKGGDKGGDDSLADVAYTLLCGRQRFAVRLARVVASCQELARELSQARADLARRGDGERRDRSTLEAALHGLGERLLEELRAPVEPDAARDKLTMLAELFERGSELDWRRLFGAEARRVPLPTYPFARTRHWLGGPAAGAAASHRERLAPEMPIIDDHRVAGRRVVPAALFVELARRGLERSGRRGAWGLRELRWRVPVVVDEPGLDVEISNDGQAIAFAVEGYGRVGHARVAETGGSDGNHEARAASSLPALAARCARRVDVAALYARLAAAGLHYGPALRTIEALACGDGEALAVVAMGQSEAPAALHRLPPALLDGAMQSVAAVMADRAGDTACDAPTVPVAIERVFVRGELPSRCHVHVVARPQVPAAAARFDPTFDLTFLDPDGQVVAAVDGLEVQRSSAPALAADARQRRGRETTSVFPLRWKDAISLADPPHDGAGPGTLWIFDEGQRWADELARQAAGAAVQVRPGPAFQRIDERRYVIRPGSADDCARLFDQAAAGGLAPARIVHAWADATGDDPLVALHVLARVWLERGAAEPLEIALAPAADGWSRATALAGAAYLRTLAREQPRLAWRCIDIDRASEERLGRPRIIAAELAAAGDAGAEIRYVDGIRQRRTVAVDIDGGETGAELPVHAGGVYLITGGAGGIGRAVADDLARRAPIKLALCGRSPASPATEAALRDLRGLGSEAVYLRADVTDRGETERLIGEVVRRLGPIRGVIHAAGVLREAMVGRLELAELRAVIAPKLLGARWLDELTVHQPLDFFALFSSIAAVVGVPGLAAYAYGNAALGALAEHRQRAGHPGTSLAVHWSLWRGGGMTVDSATSRWLRDGHHLAAIEIDGAMAALASALASGAPQCVVAAGDPDRLARWLAGPSIAGEVRADAPVAPELRARVMHRVCEVLARGLRVPAAELTPETRFERYGLESILIVSLTRALEATFGALPRTLLFEHRTIGELVDHLARHGRSEAELAAELAAEPAPVPAHEAAAAPRTSAPAAVGAPAPGPAAAPSAPGPIAIIGMAGRYPKADDVDAFWANLAAGRDCIEEVPADRWPLTGFFAADGAQPGRSTSKWGGFLSEIDCFDSLLFNISPREAEGMDPQERLFLESAWAAFEHAGYCRAQLAGTAVGVFVGVMWGTYQLYGAEPARRAAGILPSSSYGSIANRVSYVMDLRGPSLAVDTMCSSSLTAIHLACTSILTGECAMAIAGGVNICAHPNKYLQLSQAKFLSSDGRCRSFGAGGDGYVPGEGVGAVVLKRLADAERDGDHILAVIRASAIDHGGRTNGYSVPSPGAQAATITAALARADIAPDTIGYVEAHGTGTSLGDPIEIRGLAQAFGGRAPAAPACAIGSVKSNIGHLESAAAVAGLTKVVLQLHHRELAPSLHAETLNPDLGLDATPFRVQRQRSAWRPITRPAPGGGPGVELPRRAGVSSFGAGGSNGHLIVEEYRASSRPPGLPDGAGSEPFVLSARDVETLRGYARRIAAFLARPARAAAHDPGAVLADLCAAAAEALALPAQAIDPGLPLAAEYGLDAVSARRLCESMAARTGLVVTADLNLHDSLDAVARRVANRLAGETGATPPELTLADVCYTSQVGREPLAERLAIVATTLSELAGALMRYAEHGELVDGAYAGRALAGAAALPAGEAERVAERVAERLDERLAERLAEGFDDGRALAARWVRGEPIAWAERHRGRPRRRVMMPGYPFARVRHWLRDPGAHDPIELAAPSAAPVAAVEGGTPMSTSNTAPAPFGPYRPVQPEMLQTASDLSQRKSAYLESFTRAYCRARAGSREQSARYRASYADYRAAPYFHMALKEMCFSVVPARAEGARLWDVDGNAYVDVAMDFGVNLFGHQPAFLRQAIVDQLDRGFPLPFRSEAGGRAAQLLCELTGNERAAFVQSGSEAVMTAMRLARHVTGRKKIVLFENSYHGLSDGVLVRNVEDNGRKVTRPVIPAIPEGVVDAVVVLPYGVPEALAEIRARSGELAAVLVEPVQSRNPALQPRAFLHELRELTSQRGVALIFDEIITGFRCAPGGAQAWFGVPADIVTYGKILSGGVPLGAVAGRRAFMDAVDGGDWQFGDDSYPRSPRTFFGGTHAQNPLALAAAAAVLDHLRREGPALQRRLNERCAAMVGELDAWLRTERVGLRLASFASLFRFIPERANLLETNLFLLHMWQNGVLISDIGNNFLSAAHGDAEVAAVIEAVRTSIRDLRRGGYFTAGEDRAAPPPPAPTPATPATPAAVTPAPAATPTQAGSMLSRIVGQLERSR